MWTRVSFWSHCGATPLKSRHPATAKIEFLAPLATVGYGAAWYPKTSCGAARGSETLAVRSPNPTKRRFLDQNLRDPLGKEQKTEISQPSPGSTHLDFRPQAFPPVI